MAGNRVVGELLAQSPPQERIQRQPNETGMPNDLKSAIEHLSGYSLDDVRTHYHSAKPAQVDALAYTRGGDIELGPGQDRHLPHEAWHVVQQMRGQVKPTAQIKGVSVNDDGRLEREADLMGSRAKGIGGGASAGEPIGHTEVPGSPSVPVIQRQKGLQPGDPVTVKTRYPGGDEDEWFKAVIVSVEAGGDEYEVQFDDKFADAALPKVYSEAVVKKSAAVARAAPVDKIPPWSKPHLELPDKYNAPGEPEMLFQDKVKKVVGEDAKVITDLSEDQVEELLAVFRTVFQPSQHLKNLIASLDADLTDLRNNAEKKETWTARESEINTTIASLESEAFEKKFSVTPEKARWQDLELAIKAWWDETKAKEGKLEFATAFKANRMTARQVSSGQRRGPFQAAKEGKAPDPKTDRWITLDNTVEGIGKRQKPESFLDQATINKEGTHDLSASLLDGESKGAQIYNQLKFYKDAIVVFMPLPEESDLRIFSALARVQGKDQDTIDTWGRMLTRPIFAQSSDMGTRYVDTAPDSVGEGTFRYGITGTVIRKAKDRARKINPADMAARKKGALSYVEVVRARETIKKVNEVVMAYRQHQSGGVFPMFAKWDETKKYFEVVSKDDVKISTGKIITNEGEYKDRV